MPQWCRPLLCFSFVIISTIVLSRNLVAHLCAIVRLQTLKLILDVSVDRVVGILANWLHRLLVAGVTIVVVNRPCTRRSGVRLGFVVIVVLAIFSVSVVTIC